MADKITPKRAQRLKYIDASSEATTEAEAMSAGFPISEEYKEYLMQEKLEDELFIYNFAVVQPLIAAKVISRRPDYKELVVNCHGFTQYMTNSPFAEWVHKSKPTKKEIDNITIATDKFVKAIYTNNMDKDYKAVVEVLKTKSEKLTAFKEIREGIKSHKYTDGLLYACKLLMNRWEGDIGSKEKITAYNKGQTYIEKNNSFGGEPIRVKYIIADGNPGGAFIQRCLDLYCGLELTVDKMETLLNKVNKEVPTMEDARDLFAELYPARYKELETLKEYEDFYKR